MSAILSATDSAIQIVGYTTLTFALVCGLFNVGMFVFCANKCEDFVENVFGVRKGLVKNGVRFCLFSFASAGYVLVKRIM